jgi:hypothetical protein
VRLRRTRDDGEGGVSVANLRRRIQGMREKDWIVEFEGLCAFSFILFSVGSAVLGNLAPLGFLIVLGSVSRIVYGSSVIKKEDE